MRSILAAAFLAVITLATAPTAFAQGQVMFSYQGRVKVQGQPFNGTGQFKFAIVTTDGSTTLWSNDGTGTTGNEPAAHLTLPVADGIFNAMVGDPSAGMQSINSTIFQSATPLKLRVWFNNGALGFQQLNPDFNLVNLALTTLETGTSDFSIYVNGTTGNDANNGLTPGLAKKTIQAAVDTLPDRIRANVTINIADGTYRETVRMFGLTVEPDKSVTLLGDETWTTVSATKPAVIISGADTAGTNPPRIRTNGVRIIDCSGVVLRGLQVSDCNETAIVASGSAIQVQQCETFNNSFFGVEVSLNSSSVMDGVLAHDNDKSGIYVAGQSSARIWSSGGKNNDEAGLRLNGFGTVQLMGRSNFSNNAYGLIIQHASSVVFTGSASITNNTLNGLYISYNSYTENHTVNTYTANGSPNIQLIYGGMTTY